MRYTLRDRNILQWVMQHPGRGAPYTVRSLAEAIGLTHHSLVGHLLSGRTRDCDLETAHAIAGAVGVAVLVLFAPPASPETNVVDTDRNLSAEGERP
ncbi:hypothetical protein GCM10009544_15630 [Streptomyces stramineus]|uniref:HTH cro/C1-type domain-containing protein n=1 Tax=Streptomyces stramineus TaxID=173861 RepID=A0ABN0ZNU8_9ACTN